MRPRMCCGAFASLSPRRGCRVQGSVLLLGFVRLDGHISSSTGESFPLTHNLLKALQHIRADQQRTGNYQSSGSMPFASTRATMPKVASGHAYEGHFCQCKRVVSLDWRSRQSILRSPSILWRVSQSTTALRAAVLRVTSWRVRGASGSLLLQGFLKRPFFHRMWIVRKWSSPGTSPCSAGLYHPAWTWHTSPSDDSRPAGFYSFSGQVTSSDLHLTLERILPHA